MRKYYTDKPLDEMFEIEDDFSYEDIDKEKEKQHSYHLDVSIIKNRMYETFPTKNLLLGGIISLIFSSISSFVINIRHSFPKLLYRDYNNPVNYNIFIFYFMFLYNSLYTIPSLYIQSCSKKSLLFNIISSSCFIYIFTLSILNKNCSFFSSFFSISILMNIFSSTNFLTLKEEFHKNEFIHMSKLISTVNLFIYQPFHLKSYSVVFFFIPIISSLFNQLISHNEPIPLSNFIYKYSPIDLPSKSLVRNNETPIVARIRWSSFSIFCCGVLISLINLCTGIRVPYTLFSENNYKYDLNQSLIDERYQHIVNFSLDSCNIVYFFISLLVFVGSLRWKYVKEEIIHRNLPIVNSRLLSSTMTIPLSELDPYQHNLGYS